MKVIFLPIAVIVFMISAINPVYSMYSSDEQDESSRYSSLQKKELDINEDLNEEENDSNFNASPQDNEIDQLVRAEPWGATAEKLFIKAINNRGLLNPLEYEDDLRMLLDIAKTGTTNPATRPALVDILTFTFIKNKEIIEAITRLNCTIVLDSSLPLNARESAINYLEETDSPENKKLAYEVRTSLAKNKSLLFKDRFKFVKHFLYSNNVEDLKHAIKLFKDMLLDHNYSSEVSNEILYGLRSAYSDQPDLYKYAQKRILKILGCNKTSTINSRFLLMSELLELEQKGYYSTNDHESDIDKELFNTVKHQISEEKFKSLLRLKLAPLGEDRLQGSCFLVVKSFYQTPDNELPPLQGNLVSLLNLIGFGYLKEYEEAKKRVEVKYQIDFFNSIKTCKFTKSIWNSMIEDARKDAHIMQELKEYLKNYLPNTEANVNDLLS